MKVACRFPLRQIEKESIEYKRVEIKYTVEFPALLGELQGLALLICAQEKEGEVKSEGPVDEGSCACCARAI